MKTQAWMKTGLVTLAAWMPLSALAQDAPQTPAPVFVQTMIAPDPDTALSRRFFGKVSALETVDVSFEVGGYLSLIDAREGAVVTQGTTLAQLDLAPFERAVTRAEIALEQAIRTEQRFQKLATRNVASQVQADDATTARDLAEVTLAEAKDALSDATITAPFDGVVADRIGTAFSTIQPGQPMLRLHNLSEIRVEFDLPERLLTQIEDVAAVRFTGLVAQSEAQMPLEFAEFRAETGGIGQSYTVSLIAPSSGMDVLMPGRTVTVEARIPNRAAGVTLPATAVTTAADGTFHVVAVEGSGDGLVARHLPVRVSSQNGTSFAVEGIAPQTEVVTVGAHLIDDGQAVKRFTGLTVEGS